MAFTPGSSLRGLWQEEELKSGGIQPRPHPAPSALNDKQIKMQKLTWIIAKKGGWETVFLIAVVVFLVGAILKLVFDVCVWG